ncbi:alpha/beta fold hydrolase [Flavobacterium croceum]|uniref:Pimeloyl-ACP methyl ester carboxylesterase n=1 Tax=Flavobacterium croceum DSM 17960 TaxID=1121886 RepID=A0A2S4N6M9_9FLAO|nr:alpha/beta hydrolase [Flavobacterium croceum]POS01331.1 pimeloyl-ACP methyl ester carboxylesterase [Flavobacterium croceum DSM 17960]
MISYTTYPNSSSTEWVTFVHGAGGSSAIWFKQIKAFQKHFNVLLLDLRGHGNSKSATSQSLKNKYTFKGLSHDIIEVLDALKIHKSHFVGISLGTILIRQLAELQPQRVNSMIMGGAILKMNFRSQILMKFGNVFKYVLPYLVLYKLFAFIIMPKQNHKKSRLLFINEAKKLYQKEFIKWFKLTSEINPLLKWFRQVELNIPTFYIMGEEDYMFLGSVQKVVQAHQKSSCLKIIENCGHVVNVEQAHIFNNEAIGFIQKINQ